MEGSVSRIQFVSDLVLPSKETNFMSEPNIVIEYENETIRLGLSQEEFDQIGAESEEFLQDLIRSRPLEGNGSKHDSEAILAWANKAFVAMWAAAYHGHKSYAESIYLGCELNGRNWIDLEIPFPYPCPACFELNDCGHEVMESIATAWQRNSPVENNCKACMNASRNVTCRPRSWQRSKRSRRSLPSWKIRKTASHGSWGLNARANCDHFRWQVMKIVGATLSILVITPIPRNSSLIWKPSNNASSKKSERAASILTMCNSTSSIHERSS